VLSGQFAQGRHRATVALDSPCALQTPSRPQASLPARQALHPEARQDFFVPRSWRDARLFEIISPWSIPHFSANIGTSGHYPQTCHLMRRTEYCILMYSSLLPIEKTSVTIGQSYNPTKGGNNEK
jgi:hypothetical protein